MKDLEFKNFIIYRLSSPHGVSSFTVFMFKNLERWNDIDFSDIQDIIEKSKNKIGLKDLFPFFYKFLGIDLYKYYEETVGNGSTNNMCMILQKSRNFDDIHFSDLEIISGYISVIFPRIYLIRQNLLQQGAQEAELVKFSFPIFS